MNFDVLLRKGLDFLHGKVYSIVNVAEGCRIFIDTGVGVKHHYSSEEKKHVTTGQMFDAFVCTATFSCFLLSFMTISFLSIDQSIHNQQC